MAQSAPKNRLVRRIARSQGLLVPWILTLVLALGVAVFAPVAQRWEWFAAAAGVSLILTFAVHIIIARSDGFLLRVSTAVGGSILLLGFVSLVTALFTAVSAGVSMFPAEFAVG